MNNLLKITLVTLVIATSITPRSAQAYNPAKIIGGSVLSVWGCAAVVQAIRTFSLDDKTIAQQVEEAYQKALDRNPNRAFAQRPAWMNSPEEIAKFVRKINLFNLCFALGVGGAGVYLINQGIKA